MLEDLTPPIKYHKCGFTKVRDSLDGDDQHLLDQALTNTEWSTLALSKALSALGVGISYAVLYRHRTGNCACYVNRDAKRTDA